ncbi:hypothetical protein L9F63_010177, partial [Diploptera punctata]
ARAGTVIGICCNIACLLAILLKPYMPVTSDIMKEQLQAPDDVLVIVPEFTMLLPPRHKLGKPSPLFTKIEPAQVEQLKQQFSGRQKSRSPEANVRDVTAIAKLSAAVTQQAELVRMLKTSGAARSIWQPHVAVLLELKQQLAAVQGIDAAAAASNSNGLQVANPAEVARLEAEIAKQVMQMKSSGAAKSEWQPHVNILLGLKSQLAGQVKTKRIHVCSYPAVRISR